MARIVLGVAAGVAAYKSAELASTLTQRGDEVRTILTAHACEFIGPLTFQAVTQQPAYTGGFDVDAEHRPVHISLPEWADVIVVAPATADIIAKLSGGFGDELLTATILASTAPIVIAPSMNDRMWNHPIVAENLDRLRRVNYRIVEPASGHLACGAYGPGRLADTDTLIAAIDRAVAATDGSDA